MKLMNEAKGDSDIEQDIYRMLTKTFILLDDCDRQFFAEHGLSARQFWALQHLDEQQGCSMVNLSRVLLTDKSNVTGIVDRLERLKLAVRTPAPHDRRVILITLTPEGRRLRDTLNEEHQARIRDLIRIAGNGILHTLLENLTIISHNLEAYLRQANAPSISRSETQSSRE